jgi:chromosome segregation ATPase
MSPDLQQQMSRLSEQIDDLEGQLGEVAGEHAELSSAMAPFLTRYRQEVLRYQEELAAAQREVADLRVMLGDQEARNSSRSASASPIDDEFLSVEAQYERVWKGKKPPPPTDPRDPNMAPANPALKKLYGKLVANLYPALADTPAEQTRRKGLMRQVSEAFVRRDRRSLEAMADSQRDRSNLPALVDPKIVRQLEERAILLEELIHRYEGESFELRYGDIARLKAQADQAEARGQDFLAQLNHEIRQELQGAQRMVAELRARL